MLNKNRRHFLYAVITVAVITACVMIRAIIGGVFDEYHLPLNEWPAELMLTQCMMIVIYTAVFTGIFSVPLWYFFLGESDKRD